MDTELTVLSERVDDIPLLLAQLERMGLGRLLNAHFPVHGNRSGLSLGLVASIWLTHILSEGDHRLNHVQAWVAPAQIGRFYISGCSDRPVLQPARPAFSGLFCTSYRSEWATCWEGIRGLLA